MKNGFIVIALIASASLTGCATTTLSELGRDKNESLDGAKFNTQLPGTVRVEVRAQEAGYQCQAAKPETLPLISLVDADGGKFQGKVECADSKHELLVDFPRAIGVGTYSVSIPQARGLGHSARGVILFAPTEPEKKSGANQNYQGASELKVGVNEGDIAPALGNRTDWWKIEVPTLTGFSMIFQQDVDASEAQANVFRMSGGRMKPVTTLISGKAQDLRLEGNYYVSVHGIKFGKSAKYSLAVAKLDSSAPSKGGAGETIPIVDLWPVSNTRTAVVLGAGANRGIKAGDVIKIFSQNGKLLDGCTVSGASENESECAIDKVIKSRDEARARKTL